MDACAAASFSKSSPKPPPLTDSGAPCWHSGLTVAEVLHTQIGQASAYELEQSIDLRLVDVLAPNDVFALWQQFGFGALVQRDSREALLELVGKLIEVIAAQPFTVQSHDQSLSISVGMALAPAPETSLQARADRWIASAFAAQGMAHRLGGRDDGVLEQHSGKLSPERVMLVREAVKKALLMAPIF